MTATPMGAGGGGGAGAARDAAARIGPNAVIQLAAALAPRVGDAVARRLFEQAGLSAWWLWPPERMVPEGDVARLHRVVRGALDPATAREVSRDAGRRTADYLLAHRIPKAVQAGLRLLPASWAAAALLRAIGRHAWTFAGTGRFEVRRGGGGPGPAGRAVHWTLAIHDNPLCRGLHAESPACDYYAATFERLFRVLVHAGTSVSEVACEARGDAACRFEVRWG